MLVDRVIYVLRPLAWLHRLQRQGGHGLHLGKIDDLIRLVQREHRPAERAQVGVVALALANCYICT
jgi:hypothetical protein